ncbi:hypothetical protein EPUL_000621 [Erysiphe pulchra]|uniref:tRNA (adenine(58)-N(1))-methyltransferase catalytic subunit TRM61 n=1 Tax=Erysiphe pulchra TaxID=225359 RepID=A0A2S4Q209_9PEZI|nr:hypothetical protein EPUL_000621 [Erysiphe pulchra]
MPGAHVSYKKLKNIIKHDEIIGKSIRDLVRAKNGVDYRIYRPTIGEYTDNSPRIVTPIYSQDASLIVSLLDLHPTVPGTKAEKLEIFEAGTGHGALTLYLARAIHAANTLPPDLPSENDIATQNKNAVKEKYEAWRAQRRAIIHTLDNQEKHSSHAATNIKRFRHGIYFPHIDFHQVSIEDFITKKLLEASNVPFLEHAILDLPSPHDYMKLVSSAIKDNGQLLVFVPSITQINKASMLVRVEKLPLALENVLELGGMIGTGGREWDVRPVKPRVLQRAELAEADSDLPKLAGPTDETNVENTSKNLKGWEMVRTILQFTTIFVFLLTVVYFLDSQFRVLPSSIHNHLPTHHPGLVITDITVTTCSSISLFTSCKLNPNYWHRIEKDLYLGNGWISKAYVHVQGKKEEDLLPEDKVVFDVTVGRLDPTIREIDKNDIKWESRPMGIWLKRSAKRHASDSYQAVTAVDILFGADAVDPRVRWQLVGTALLLNTGGEEQQARLTIRRGSELEVSKPIPQINEHGKFKIMQVSDLHLSTGTGKCRDPQPPDSTQGCEADPRTLEFMEKLLDSEKPDIVVLSGDQINGETAPDAQSAIFKYAAPLIERKIPFATIFGNHDDEGSLSREAQMSLIESLPYSLSITGPSTIDGVGNYYIEVQAHGSKNSALTIYLLDSHSYSPDERNFKGYDWLKKNQIDWFRATAKELKRNHEGYSHIHMNLAFIHIPLPEFRNESLPRKGAWREGVTAPLFNSGFRDALVEEGVLIVGCGHDHANEYCALSSNNLGNPALWMCYAGGAGFGGYGGYGGYHRRIRFYELDVNEARITTWKKVESGIEASGKFDEQVVVDGGKMKALVESNNQN